MNAATEDRGAEGREYDTVSQNRIIGIDVSRDWLDIHCLPDGKRLRFPNTNEWHARLVDSAQSVGVLVCFEAIGGPEWRLWFALDAAGIATRQLPPAQIKAFAASQGTRAKTDRIDAELIARFMVFRPDVGRTLPHAKIRLIRRWHQKRGQLVETRKRLLAQIKAHGKLRSADMFEAIDAAFKGLLDRQIAQLEAPQLRHFLAELKWYFAARVNKNNRLVLESMPFW